ncbi:pyrimidine 5'-nucleotidase [Paraferrimonas sp. SM1919]|uniref:pyrimidine 5'-nucleotidase n=1 Tax=Paraferrimonas sp. SM1919 TaxID=2662263 RepID=UPI0013D3B49F|nr:pyrimidine 5'-nucleotidase [Paraferrimonas sp. SM1919]
MTITLEDLDWVVFDADETLFDFNIYEGLKTLFNSYDVSFTEKDFAQYQQLNGQLWLDYEANKITMEQIKLGRFAHWSERLNVEPLTLNHGFLDAMATTSKPLSGAIALLSSLQDKVKVAIMTNGMAKLQYKRLRNTGVEQFIDALFISEEVGAAKPSKEIYLYAMAKMGHPQPQRVLMVGDNPSTDILGANSVNWRSCLYDPANKYPQHQADFKVNHLNQLQQILVK